ncbi:unnamed protein product [Schistocephalus solidus]|uniref:AlaDh_PNT_N domain-containing protein n=1 Tax=Schistocephalus solidus TaxID=70667 RepID=A0A183TSE0_SCHSO|nr:unnamed protein product [Schistocephalus solidus]
MSKQFTAVISIPRETVNPWERRTVLTPTHVEALVRRGIRVIVQPSNRRIFTCDEYLAAGAEVNEDLSEATVILGVKRPTGLTTDDLMANKTYAFFTHTIKAQKDNMELLDTILERPVWHQRRELCTSLALSRRLVGVLAFCHPGAQRWLGRGIIFLELGRVGQEFCYGAELVSYRNDLLLLDLCL